MFYLDKERTLCENLKFIDFGIMKQKSFAEGLRS